MAKKARTTKLRFRKDDPLHNLLAAVQHYVLANSGEIVVIGGVEVIEMPHDAGGKFRIAVGCLGRKPVKPEVVR